MLCGSQPTLRQALSRKAMRTETSITYAYDDSCADVFYVCALTSYVSYASFRLA